MGAAWHACQQSSKITMAWAGLLYFAAVRDDWRIIEIVGVGLLSPYALSKFEGRGPG